MITIRYFLIASILLVGMSSSINKANKEPDVYKFIAGQSTVTWTSTTEDGSSHKGQIKFKSGTLKVDTKILLGGFSYINMQSLSCSDISDDGFNREFILDMRSAEQLNVVKYKEATFKILKAKRLDVSEGQPNYDISAVVSLKGIKTPVDFKATITMKKGKMNLKGKFTLPSDKTEVPYNMDWALNITAAKA